MIKRYEHQDYVPCHLWNLNIKLLRKFRCKDCPHQAVRHCKYSLPIWDNVSMFQIIKSLLLKEIDSYENKVN